MLAKKRLFLVLLDGIIAVLRYTPIFPLPLRICLPIQGPLWGVEMVASHQNFPLVILDSQAGYPA